MDHTFPNGETHPTRETMIARALAAQDDARFIHQMIIDLTTPSRAGRRYLQTHAASASAEAHEYLTALIHFED